MQLSPTQDPSTLPDNPGSGRGLSGCELELVDRAGVALVAGVDGHPDLLPFSSVASVSSRLVLLASLFGECHLCCGPLAWMCTCTYLGECFSFEHCQALFLGSAFALAPPPPNRAESPDDSLPTGPPPQIRILKRPTSNGVVSSPNSTSRPALPVKSLAQREAEYAEARRRILGSASPEEEQEKPILDSTRSQQLASWFGGKQEADRPTRISQPEDSRQPSNVIRQPLGPDGSQGFKQRR
ncbi:SUZ RNA binding domain containing 1 [Cricetulus griseus]